MLLWGCCLAAVLAADSAVTIATFDGPEPLRGWSADGGSLGLAAGHTGHGAALTYNFVRGGSASAIFTPVKPLAAKHRAALSLWIHADPAVKLDILVNDRSGRRRYPFEALTLESPEPAWREVTVPLTAEGRIDSLTIAAEPRYPLPTHGSILFDDVRLLDSPDRLVTLHTDAPLAPAAAPHFAPRFGVNVHGIDDERQIEAAHTAGFSFVRADLLWRAVERNGQFRFVVADRLLAATEPRGMGVLWILDYGHPQHGGEVPRQPNDIAAFAHYAETVAAHFRGRNVRYEIWNEPNIDRFWPPHPNATEYAAVARAAVDAVHRADPDAKVAIGGLARIDLAFLQEVLDTGATGDAISVHPYRTAAPETISAELSRLRQMVAAKLGPAVEIWDTEWGYASYDYFTQALGGDGHTAPNRKRQAVLGLREALSIWALDVRTAVWYDLRDDGDDPRNGEKNYGLLDRQYADKPAMIALRQLMHLAAGHTLVGLVRDLPDGVHAMRLDGSASRTLVVWSDQPDARITLRVPPGLISATNLLGEPLTMKKNEITLTEVDGPVYLEFPVR